MKTHRHTHRRQSTALLTVSYWEWERNMAEVWKKMSAWSTRMLTLIFTSVCFTSKSWASFSVSSFTLFNDVHSESSAPAAGIMLGAASRQCKRIVFTPLSTAWAFVGGSGGPPAIAPLLIDIGGGGGGGGPIPRGKNGGGGGPPIGGGGGGGGGGPPGIIIGGGGGGPPPFIIGGGGGIIDRPPPNAMILASSRSSSSSKLRSCTTNFRVRTLSTIHSHWRSLSDLGFDSKDSGIWPDKPIPGIDRGGGLAVACCRPASR